MNTEQEQLGLPWSQSEYSKQFVLTKNNWTIGAFKWDDDEIASHQDELNAAFAVRAANSHHALVEAGQAVLDAVFKVKEGNRMNNGAANAIQKLEAALKLATQ